MYMNTYLLHLQALLGNLVNIIDSKKYMYEIRLNFGNITSFYSPLFNLDMHYFIVTDTPLTRRMV